MSTPARRLLAPVLLVLALTLTACVGDGPDPTPSGSSSEPTSSPTASATPTRAADAPPPAPDDAEWLPELRTLDGGRKYWIAVPSCAPSKQCKKWKTHPRKMIIWMHGLGQPEIGANASFTMRNVLQATGSDDVVPVYAVTAGDHFSWDADLCCAFEKIDELGYLSAVVDDAAKRTGIDKDRVGLAGASNGGLLATKAICTQPEKYKAIAIWAASWKGPCKKGPVTIRHWHGDADGTVKLAGGPFQLGDRSVNFPPADWLETRVAPGSSFELTVVPGATHTQMPAGRLQEWFRWLDEHL